MFCLFSNIFICSIESIGLLNLSNFSYIFNCISEYNSYSSNQNYINLNLDSINLNNLNVYGEFYKWVEANSQEKIIILDKTGFDKAMEFGIYMLMKMSNSTFIEVYDKLFKLTTLADKFYYYFLQTNEHNIIEKNNIFTQPILMDTKF